MHWGITKCENADFKKLEINMELLNHAITKIPHCAKAFEESDQER